MLPKVTDQIYSKFDFCSDRRVLLAVVAAVMFGLVLRLWHFLGARPLWGDEAMIAFSIVGTGGISSIFGELDYGQMAPFGWLVIEKAIYGVFGGRELTLRLSSLVLGVASLVLFVQVVRYFFGSAKFIILAILLFCVNWSMIYYSAEVKHYIFDTFFALSILLIALQIIDTDKISSARLAILWLAGAISLTMSFTAPIVLGATGGVLMMRQLRSGDRRSLFILLIIAAAWLLQFYIIYEFHRYFQPETLKTMKSVHHQAKFLPIFPKTLGDIEQYYDSIVEIFLNTVRVKMPEIWTLAFLVGAVAMMIGGGYRGALVGAPFVLAVAVAMLHLYPFGKRFSVFLVPHVLIIAVFGAEVILERLRFRPAFVFAAVGAILLTSVGKTATEYLLPRPFEKHNVQPVLDAIRRESQPGDTVYVQSGVVPLFRTYGDDFSTKPLQVKCGRSPNSGWQYFLADFDALKGGRVWAVFGSDFGQAGLHELKAFQLFMNARGRELLHRKYRQFHLLLIEVDPVRAANAVQFGEPTEPYIHPLTGLEAPGPCY